MSVKKKGGVDRMFVKVLHMIQDFIVKPLVHIANISFIKGIFPDFFKRGRKNSTEIKPLFKNGDKNEVNNYCPISLISNLAKIFKKLISARLKEFLKTSSIYYQLINLAFVSLLTDDVLADIT